MKRYSIKNDDLSVLVEDDNGEFVKIPDLEEYFEKIECDLNGALILLKAGASKVLEALGL